LLAVAATDVDCVMHTLDFGALQDNIANIAFCDIEQELVCVSQSHIAERQIILIDYRMSFNFYFVD